ncbi:MAG TPA: hypothetical protein VJ717_12770 [Gemmatimonadaceae bacterium]|nr:hypothetical protein [Gemmatimonadaceae bacterium]
MISPTLARQHLRRHHDHTAHGHAHRAPSEVEHHDVTSEFLTLRVAAGHGEPERLLLIGRPESGQVRVREWTSRSWNTEGDDYEIDAEELLAALERDFSAHRAMSEEIYRVRQWLTGF